MRPAQICLHLIEMWPQCSQLCIALGELAKRYRYLEIMPNIFTLYLLQILSADDWFESKRDIGIVARILKDSQRFHGGPLTSLCEVGRTILMSRLSPSKPTRSFNIGRLVPVKVQDMMDPQYALNVAIRDDIQKEEDSTINKNLCMKAFPGAWFRNECLMADLNK